MKIEGQSSINDNFTLTAIMNPELTWIVNIPILKSSGIYEINVETMRSFGLLTSFHYVGKGAFSTLLENVQFKIRLAMESASKDMKINVTDVLVDLTFSNFEIQGENNEFNGEPIDWKEASRKIAPFYSVFRLLYKYRLAQYVKDALNDALGVSCFPNTRVLKVF